MRMPKSLASIVLSSAGHASLQSQLAAKLRALIQHGQLGAGESVPPSRQLAADLRVSRNTVTLAYDRLVDEGYLESHPRSGLFVCGPLGSLPAPTRARDIAARQSQLERVPHARAFRESRPDVRLFPLALWNRVRGRALKAHRSALLQYQSELPLGLPALRRAIAAYVRDRRGVSCDWQQIAITSGSQHALYMLAHLLVRPGAVAMMEDPGYRGARRALMSVGAAIQPVGVDAQGLLPPTNIGRKAALIYTTPSRQYPTGACLPVTRRMELIRWAARSGTWIIEDDYDTEFRYNNPPLPSLHSLDPGGRVIYVGTMSKTLFPSLRLGYVILPWSLLGPFGELRSAMDDHGSLMDQATTAEFLEMGAYYSHIRRCRREYGARLETFLTAVRETGLPLDFPHADGGINVSGFLPESSDDTAWVTALADVDVDARAHSALAVRRVRPGLIFGFTAFDHTEIRAAVRRMSRVRSAQP
jgi:GntR family transcriptional regulator/MocR family aminotransferase